MAGRRSFFKKDDVDDLAADEAKVAAAKEEITAEVKLPVIIPPVVAVGDVVTMPPDDPKGAPENWRPDPMVADYVMVDLKCPVCINGVVYRPGQANAAGVRALVALPAESFEVWKNARA